MRTLKPSRGLLLGLVAIVIAAACGSSNPSPEAAVHGGTVSVLGVWSDGELDSFNAVLAPFTAQTGITVNYETSRDQDAILTTRVTAGNPPDLAAAPSPSLLTRFANQGKVINLENIMNMTQLKSDYDKGWIDLGTVGGHLVQVFSWADLKGLVWYDPKVFAAKGYTVPKTWQDMITLQNKIKSDGTTPWCMAVESGAASGWAGSDFHKEIALSTVGPATYDRWWQGKPNWTSPAINSTSTPFPQLPPSPHSHLYRRPHHVINTN